MANRAARFTKAELANALQAANECGQPIAGCEIDVNGTLRIIFGDREPLRLNSTLEERAEASAQARRVARRRG